MAETDLGIGYFGRAVSSLAVMFLLSYISAEMYWYAGFVDEKFGFPVSSVVRLLITVIVAVVVIRLKGEKTKKFILSAGGIIATAITLSLLKFIFFTYAFVIVSGVYLSLKIMGSCLNIKRLWFDFISLLIICVTSGFVVYFFEVLDIPPVSEMSGKEIAFLTIAYLFFSIVYAFLPMIAGEIMQTGTPDYFMVVIAFFVVCACFASVFGLLLGIGFLAHFFAMTTSFYMIYFLDKAF